MIPADFIFTEKLCIIRNILANPIRYSHKIPGEIKIIKLTEQNIELALRYDSLHDTYVLKNQYHEKELSNQAKLFISFLIGYGLDDENLEFLKINNEKIPLDIRGLFISVYLILIMRHIHGNSMPRCSVLCPFKSICNIPEEVNIEDMILDPINTLNNFIENTDIFEYNTRSPEDVLNIVKQQMITKISDLLFEQPHSESLIDTLKKFEKKKIELSTTYHKIMAEIGKERADTIMDLANNVMNLEFKKIDITDIQNYNGYLTIKNNIVIPSDKFWNLFLKQPMENEILEIYEFFIKK